MLLIASLVREEADDGVVREAEAVEGIEHRADVRVHVAHRRVVASTPNLRDHLPHATLLLMSPTPVRRRSAVGTSEMGLVALNCWSSGARSPTLWSQ